MREMFSSMVSLWPGKKGMWLLIEEMGGRKKKECYYF